MIEVCEGIFRLEPSDYAELFTPDLLDIPEKFHAPYGFKLVEIEGKKLWQPGTFEDYSVAVAKMKGIDVSEVEQKRPSDCHNSSPTRCAGGCGQFGSCLAYILQPGQTYLYCHCEY
ncbi:hypothetical protein ACQE3E_23495 (plasmid) [Methylomonas sp. MED-D]|uniref:hypothetical protein n=1 Tax=Methylomonas sp. MED-D TaxID=3418768 RepID=UPI003D0850B5